MFAVNQIFFFVVFSPAAALKKGFFFLLFFILLLQTCFVSKKKKTECFVPARTVLARMTQFLPKWPELTGVACKIFPKGILFQFWPNPVRFGQSG